VTLEAAFIVVGAIAAVISVAILAERLPTGQRPPALRPRVTSGSRPSQLLRIERIVESSGKNGVGVHTQLRPLLVEIAEARLAPRGLRLDRHHEHVRRLLGPEAWDLVRPDRTPPGRDAPGLAPRELEAVLDRLEEL
jgi:hypothetical protein